MSYIISVAALSCDLEDIDMDLMCNQCSLVKNCRVPFGLTEGCGGTEASMMNSTLNVLKAQCEPTTRTEFTGTADCEVLRYIATSIMEECGPTCGPNEHAKVNVDENAVYCACNGKCLKDFRDDTLNGLVGTLVGILGIQFIANFFLMINSRYNLGFVSVGSSNVAPVVGKTV